MATEQKQKPELWVKRTVTVELPKKVEDYLEDLAKLCGVTVEEILAREVMGTLKSFYQGGFLDIWIQESFENRGVLEELNGEGNDEKEEE